MKTLSNFVWTSLLLLTACLPGFAGERHWVGDGLGIGRFWGSAANWSATQGGPGGAGVPTAADDVFIDGGGRTEVNVNSVCLSLTQTHAGHLTDFRSAAVLTVGAGGFHLTNGTFHTDVSNTVNLAGDFTVTGGTFTAGTGTINLNGTTSQQVNTNAPFYNLTLNNAAGFTLASGVTVNNVLTLTSGVVQTGANTLNLPAVGSVARTTGHVSGNLMKGVAAGPSSVTFEVGGATAYAPVTVAFGSVTIGGNLTARSTDGDHPAILSSAIHPAAGVNRYWTLVNSGIVFTDYAATFNFDAGDLDGGANTGTFLVDRYASGTWTTAAVGARTGASTQATGLSAFSDFAVGSPTVTYSITASASAGGTITPSGPVGVDYGNDQSFSITPNTGYHVDSVVVDGVNQGALPAYDFTGVTANHSISAFFSIDVFTIDATASAGGSISPSGAVVIPYGGNQSFTLTPDPNHHLDSVVVDGVNVGAPGVYDFTTVTAGHSIAAYYSIDVFTISASASAGGSITPPGPVSVAYGNGQSFSIAPDDGYHVDSVVVDGVNLGALTDYDFTGVSANHSIGAWFSIDMYTIDAGALAGGSIAPSGAVQVAHGSDQGFAITPAAGYFISDVFVDTVSIGATGSYTFTNVTGNHSIQAAFAVQTFSVTASAGPNGSISPAGVSAVDYGDSLSYAITPATGYFVADVRVDSVSVGPVSSWTFTNVTSDHLIEASFAIQTFTLTASAGPNGTVTPAGLTVAEYGDTVAYAITPNTGYFVADVFVDSVSVGPAAAYTFTNVTANHTIAASFSLRQYSIAASASAGGSISPAGAVPVGHGGSVSFTFTPSTGYHLDSVLVDGVNAGALPGYDFTNVTADHAIAAFFSVNMYTIAASAGAGGGIAPSGAVQAAHGADQAFTITPAAGYFIADVFVDSVSVGPVAAYTFTNVTANHTIAASFAVRTFTLTASAGPNGAISPAGVTVADYGDTVAYAITPNAGYFVADVFVDSVSVGPVTAYAFPNVTANHTIAASFSLLQYTITAGASGGGSISPSGAVGAGHGDTRSFTMTPDAGYHVDSVLVDGVNVGAAAAYDFVNVTANHAITAYFSINVYTIGATAGPGGGITPSGAVGVAHGASQVFTITPATGYYIADVHVDTVSVGATGSYTFTNVTSGHTIHATFAVQTFTVTALAGPNGSVSPAGATTVEYGDTLTVTITPDSGWFVADVVVDGASVGAVASYSFNGITANHQLQASFGTNAVPSAFALVLPADNDTIAEGALGAAGFSWRASGDADAGDTLRYTLRITGPGVDYTLGGLSDTAVTLDLGGVLSASNSYDWTVSVTDGEAVVASADTFSFFVSPATGVEGGGDLPREFALGQNYPNPFNPSTEIPFDLPERSTVTLKIFNVLGVEVMAIAAGDDMPAGSYTRAVDFSGLSSGAYFYSFSARGESGAVFEKVRKMVVIR